MQTKQSVEYNFKQEFKLLLEKYNAEFDVLVQMSEWGAMVEGVEVFIPEGYDKNDLLIREQTIINLTKWFDSNSL